VWCKLIFGPLAATESSITRQWLRAAVLILFLVLSHAVSAGPRAWEYTILGFLAQTVKNLH
jgi:hypothetical protein